MSDRTPYELETNKPGVPTHQQQHELENVGPDEKIESAPEKGLNYKIGDVDVNDPNDVIRLQEMLDQAKAATRSEHKMSLMQALRRYPKASAWSILISLAVIMEGFDTVLLGNFYAYPEFTKTFGIKQKNGKYQLTAAWQAGLSNSVNVGEIIGLIMNGYLAERYGYRKVTISALVWMAIWIFPLFFANSLVTICVGEFMCGITWGVFQTLTTSYASEVAPVALRGYLTTWVNACWGIGQLISICMLRGLLNRTDEWGWRIPYATQWIWPIPLILVALFAPESPWWLVRKGRIEDARRSLQRLTTESTAIQDGFDVDQTVAMMQHTNNLETELYKGSRYVDCFKGANLRRTEISCGCWIVQKLCGSALMGSSTYFLQSAGLPTTAAFSLTAGKFAINTVGVLVCWALMAWGVGRRALYLYGCAGMGVALLIIGGVSLIGTAGGNWAVGSMLLVWAMCYQFTLGTAAFSLITEMPSRRLLIKTVNIGRGVYNIAGIVLSSFTPYMINPSAWNWGGKTAFFWAGFNVLCVLWIFFRLPEPTGLTYAELDKLFEERVPARQFQKQAKEINVFHSDEQKVAKADTVA